MNLTRLICGAAVGALLAAASPLRAQSGDSMSSAIHIANTYRVVSNVTYLKTSTFESKLDVYQARGATSPSPTLIWIHGGNWVGGSKEASAFTLLPYMDLGWNIVNIDYRLVSTAPAPAAVEDCRCALRWVYQHAKDYNIDTTRLVVSGNSAGGQLALLVGMAPADAGFDVQCPGPEALKVAAIVNWYGFADLTDLLQGENMRPAVVTWIGNGPDRANLAKRVSPITYARAGVPPVFSIQGDADPTSPYVHTVHLHDVLTKAAVPNQLLTIPGGKHGGFTDAETSRIYSALEDFLRKIKIVS
jgi:acetyl esterase/lipase